MYILNHSNYLQVCNVRPINRTKNRLSVFMFRMAKKEIERVKERERIRAEEFDKFS